MPIITNSDNSRQSLNGDADTSLLLLNSLEGEESFVVLERSTANDVVERSTANNGVVNNGISQSTNTFQSFSNNCSFTTSNAVITSGTSITSHSQVIPIESLALPFESTNVSVVSPEEIDKRLQDVLHENVNLKENLYQTNLAMKQQLNTVRLLQERALEVQKHHQAKFEETKALIIKLGSEKNELQETITFVNRELEKLKEENKDLREAKVAVIAELDNLKEENKDLKEANLAFGTEGAKLLTENAALKKQLSATIETLQTVSLNGKKASFQPTPKEVELHELVDQLTRKLEAVERARRQQEFDIDRLTAQHGRLSVELNETQRKLAHSENELQLIQTHVVNENSLPFGEKVLRYDGLLKQFQASIQDEQTRFNSLSSWLSMTDPAGNLAQFEISELRRLLAEEQSQSVARKENLYQAISTIHELLGDFQKLGQELEKVKAAHALQESHGLAYDEMQKKGFTEKIDSLTAKLVEKEEALAISLRHLASLQEAVRLQNDETKDDKQVKTLQEKVQLLNTEIATKEESLQTKTQEINVLKKELQNLRSTKETITVLEEQAKIYQADFEAERKSRETLAAEKETILEDLRHLQRRNQELIEELSKIRRDNPGQTLPQAATINTNQRRQERSPSPTAPRNGQNMALGEINEIFHEKQEGNLCVEHCLNSLLQRAHFNAVNLAELGQEMDCAEKVILAEAGISSVNYKSFLERPSQKMDDTSHFSVQFIHCALALWGLKMIPFSSTELHAIAARTNPSNMQAFICNSHAHWFTIRRFGNQWFNLNSTLDQPEPLSDLYSILSQFQLEGYSVFIILGELPACPADEALSIKRFVRPNRQEPVAESRTEHRNTINIDLGHKEIQKVYAKRMSLHLSLSEKNHSLLPFLDGLIKGSLFVPTPIVINHSTHWRK